MSDLYRHIDPHLSAEQEDNFIRLARRLVLTSQRDDWDPKLFDIGRAATDVDTFDDLEPDQVAAHTGLMLLGPPGHAVLAGIAALPGEDWTAYQTRTLGAAFDSPLEEWLFSSLWRGRDDTAVGAAMRLMYVLDYGVPGDYRDIIAGRAESDYMDNGFLWDRVGLLPPENNPPG